MFDQSTVVFEGVGVKIAHTFIIYANKSAEKK